MVAPTDLPPDTEPPRPGLTGAGHSGQRPEPVSLKHANIMKTTVEEIAIVTDEKLAAYAHAASRASAESLVEDILGLEAAGFRVLHAIGARGTVPNSYRSAFKMQAPVYEYDPGKREVRLVGARLQNRPRGRGIPAVFEVSGDVVPPGFRCFKRFGDSLEIRKA